MPNCDIDTTNTTYAGYQVGWTDTPSGFDTTAGNVTHDGTSILLNTNLPTSYALFEVWIKGTTTQGGYSETKLTITITLDCSQGGRTINPVSANQVITISHPIASIPATVASSDVSAFLVSSDPINCNRDSFSLQDLIAPAPQDFAAGKFSMDPITYEIIIHDDTPAQYTFEVKGWLSTSPSLVGYQFVTLDVLCDATPIVLPATQSFLLYTDS